MKISRTHHVANVEGKEVLKKNPPKAQVGDGKLPNKYFVSATNDFLVYKDGQGDWASEKMGFKAVQIGKTKVFNTFKEAMNYAEELAEEISLEPKKDSLNHVSVDDRISGELATIEVIAYNSKQGIINTVKTDIERRTDTKFTEKKMEENGYKFE